MKSLALGLARLWLFMSGVMVGQSRYVEASMYLAGFALFFWVRREVERCE